MSNICYILSISYIIVLILFFVKMARNNGFFLYSPLFLIYIPFITGDLLPALSYANQDKLPDNVQYVIISTIIIYSAFLFLYRKQFTTPLSIKFPEHWRSSEYSSKRIILYLVLVFILLLTGLMTGVTIGILSGANVEGLRRTSEIGIGFLREIPYMGVCVMTLVFLMAYCKEKVLKAGIICLSLGLFFFLITGHKGGLLRFALIFLAYFCFCHRNLKWYEVIAYYSIIPIAAGILQVIRQGGKNFLESIIFFQSYSNVLFEANTLAVMRRVEGYFYWGEEYFTGLVKIIPRFLWSNKPLSFDYTLKELVGYEWEGGGIPINTPYSMFINFGYYNWIGLTVWLFIIHSCYNVLIDPNRSFYTKLVILLSLNSTIALFLGNLEVMLLFLLICAFIYGRTKMI